jgi:hypothetical protein
MHHSYLVKKFRLTFLAILTEAGTCTMKNGVSCSSSGTSLVFLYLTATAPSTSPTTPPQPTTGPPIFSLPSSSPTSSCTGCGTPATHRKTVSAPKNAATMSNERHSLNYLGLQSKIPGPSQPRPETRSWLMGGTSMRGRSTTLVTSSLPSRGV